MKDSTKKWLGFFSWLPLLIFTGSVVYFLVMVRPLLETGAVFDEHEKLNTYVALYYDQMFIWLVVGSVIGLIVLINYVVHLLRLANMHPATKAIWILVLSFTGSFALPIFYYVHLRHEPTDVPLYPSIE